MKPDDILHQLAIGGPTRAERRMLTREESGQRFLAALEHANMTNEYAAARLGIASQRISEYIHGVRIPSWTKLYHMIQTIPLDPKFFFHEIMGDPPKVKRRRNINPVPKSKQYPKEVPEYEEIGPRFDATLCPDSKNTVMVCSHLDEHDVIHELSQKAPDVHWTKKFDPVQCEDWPSNRHYFLEYRVQHGNP